jgi:uncharacterized protein
VLTLERLLYVLGKRLRLTAEPVAVPAGHGSDRMRRLRDVRESIERIARQVGASNVRVYGSVASGQDRPDSDVDLLVDFDVDTHGALPLIRLRRELEDLLNERIDLATLELLHPKAAERAVAEAVPL